MERRLLLDVVVAEGATVLQLLAGEDETLLVGRDPLFLLNLRLHALNRIGRLYINRNSFSRQGLTKYLKPHNVVNAF